MATPQTTDAQTQSRKKKKALNELNLGLGLHMKRGRSSHRYRGHRAESFVPSSDIPLLVELRARHRTFQGAYARTALGNLGYALTILRLFDSRFYRIGLIFAILGGLLLLISYARDQHSRHDFADPREEEVEAEEEGEGGGGGGTGVGRGEDGTGTNGISNGHPETQKNFISKLSGSFRSSFSRFRHRRPPIPIFSPTPPTRIFGRPFVTAGWIVIAVTLVVLMAEIGLVVLIIKLTN